jgi:asparagine synthase (glutamine-hydrolysing)
MADRLTHRGPDDAGDWVDRSAGLALAHRRLSILDLSPAGHQPMLLAGGRYALVYNGEIYNHRKLRALLDKTDSGTSWRGHSDTEVLLSALVHWGVEESLKRLNGMFAFAFWDRMQRTLYLARDRTGEKPLYYGSSNGVFLFGSELKALTAHPAWRGEVDRDALALYLRHNYVPTPWTIYRGIGKLPPGHFVAIRDHGAAIGEPVSYWDLGAIAQTGVERAAVRTEVAGLTDELEALLRDAVGCRMEADVPLGAFLSGGIDSSIVAALMQARSERPVRTFSIGFHEPGYDEAPYARAVASHLGTEHTELYVTEEQALAVVPELPHIWDEPFSDSSQIPSCLLNRLAREHITAGLTGDGGDELFYGYDRYIKGARFAQMAFAIPGPLRRLSGRWLQSIPAKVFDRFAAHVPMARSCRALGDRMHKLGELVAVSDSQAFYHHLVSHWKFPAAVVLGSTEPRTLLNTPERLPGLPGLRERMMYLDTMTYLPDDILTKVDRASMAFGLEARAPLLDHRVVEFAWRVPTSLKYRAGRGKWLLRQVLYRHVPSSLVDRPKQGFGAPIEHWLRHTLRDWAEELLNERRLREEGFFDPRPIRRMWKQHVAAERRWHYYLWDILMFQSWLDAQRVGRGRAVESVAR